MIGKKEKIELENMRKIRAYSILAKGDIPRITDTETYVVPSQNDKDVKYIVTHNGAWKCTCKDWEHHNLKHSNNIKCKHIQTVELWLKLRDKLTDALEIETDGLMEKPECVFCHSKNIKKDGMRRNKHGLKQRYRCHDCEKKFVVDRIKGYSVNKKIIALTIDLYFKGMSYRNITDSLNQHFGLELAHTTVMRWVHAFMDKISNYTDKLTPELGGIWNVDEQAIKHKDDWVWNFNILDRESRFLIANSTEDGRNLEEAKMVFLKAMRQYGQVPEMVLTDGLRAYPQAIRNTLGASVVHLGGCGLAHRANNNRIERFHGTWRQREKVRRGNEERENMEDMLRDFKTYYNFIREHEALNGKTPAQMVGLELELGRNKILDLMERSVTPECTT